MPTTTHTPGPYAVEREYINEHGNLISMYIAKAGSGRIGQVFGNCLVKTDEQVRANAKLLAAAPELLEALQLVTDCLSCALTGGSVPAAKAGSALVKASEAMEKATA